MDVLHGRQQTCGEKASQQLHKNAASYIKQVLEAGNLKSAAVRPLTIPHENYLS